MSKFAPVCPAHILQELQLARAFKDYHLVLAHDIVAHKEEYRKVFQGFSWPDAVILDNSIIELGGAVDIEIIKEAAEAVQATVVVLPDVLEDGPESAKLTIANVSPWFEAINSTTSLNGKFSLMAVPQGRTLKEFIECAEALAKVYNIGWWGIPRNFTDRLGSRKLAVQICRTLNPNRRIHLLGFSDNLLDDILTAQMHCVKGIDSAVPLRAASLGMSMSMEMKLPPRGDWWDTVTFKDQMIHNCAKIREWVGVQP